MTRVVVVGDALLDVHVSPRATVRAGADVRATIRTGPGGQGANLAVRLARLGLRVDLVCALGEDAAATIVRSALEIEGVAVSVVASDATGTVVILGGRDGERTMLSQRMPFSTGALARLGTDPEWCVVSGYLLLEPGAVEMAGALAARAARRVLVGCAVPDDALDAWRAAAAALRPDLTVLNREEAARLDTGVPPDGLVVTDAGGAVASVSGMRVEARTPSGPPAVDTTGAGDAFAAALVARLIDAPWPPSEPVLADALERAVGLAAGVARLPGAQALVEGEARAGLPR